MAATDAPENSWLALLQDAEEDHRTYHDKCDKIDAVYAKLGNLAGGIADRDFHLFWANLEVLRPSVYSRPPVPVVQPRFKDRKPLPRAACDVMERALTYDVERDDLHESLKDVRDDLCLNARGVGRVMWVVDGEGERCDFVAVNRKDFRHGRARTWKEVPWVAFASYLTRQQFEERFAEVIETEHGGRIPDGVEFKEWKPGEDDGALGGGSTQAPKKACVWEIWHRGTGMVAWVAEGCSATIEEREAYLTLEGFWPCPRPAFSTLERGTLKPVPDYLYYQDQLESITELTDRIHTLIEALKVKGFYAAGASDIGEAVEIAMADVGNQAVLIPVKNSNAFQNQSLKDSVVWWPIEQVVQVIRESVATRKQLIDDVYQISGISDIMRGETVASETLGAQQLKSQYGSIRIQERQSEMARFAADVLRLKAEVYAEQASAETLLAMSQVDDLPSAEMVQIERARIGYAVQMAQMAPQQAQEAVKALGEKVTIDAVMQLLRNQRVRPMVIEVESDSTIRPDEDAEKRRRNEFLQVAGGFIQQAAPIVQQSPELGPLAAEMFRFAAGAYRITRQLDTAIDEFAEKLEDAAKQPRQPQQPQPDPAKVASLQIQRERHEQDMRIRQEDHELGRAERMTRLAEGAS